MKIYSVVFALVFLCLTNESSSAKILNIAFFSSKSHKITYEPLLNELADRGHEVTVLSSVGFGSKKLREIITFDAMKVFEEGQDLFEMKEKNLHLNPMLMLQAISSVCNKTYDLQVVKDLLKESFDLILVPSLFNECSYGYAYKFNAPIIIVSPAAPPTYVSAAFGTPSPPSFVVNAMTSYRHDMTFYQRTINTLLEAMFAGLVTLYINPSVEKLYRDKLNDQTIPSANEILRERASLMLSNSHLSLGQPRPLLPDIIEVGGMHCRPGKPLPKDLEDFVKSSGDDGFILFSMGSALKGSNMPDHKRKVFLNAFAKLKQKVLWKWETEEMPDLPPNVKLSKWLPQQDVLGHSKIKAFITHGGLGSTTEAVYHGVPLVGIPMFADQNMNMAKAETAGFAISLEYNELTPELIVESISKILRDESYKANVQKLSKVFRDQPDKPLDRAVFWTEYVLRHKGALHLRSPARDLNFFQYHSLDVIGFLFAIVAVVLYVVFALLRFLFRLVCGKSKKIQPKDLKKKRN